VIQFFEKYMNRAFMFWTRSSPFFLFLASSIFLSLYATPQALSAPGSIPYTTVIEGITDSALLSEMKSISDTLSLQDRPPPSLGLLLRRADEDKELFSKFLRAQGYYAATVTVHVDGEKTPVQVVFRIDTGPSFVIGPVDFRLSRQESAHPLKLLKPEEIGLRFHEPFTTEKVLQGQAKLLTNLKTQGYPFPKVTDRRIIVDHATDSVSVTFSIDPGPFAGFGPLKIRGLESVKEQTVRSMVPWKEGEAFDFRLIEKAQRKLRGSGLFSIVRIETAREPDEQGQVPVTITLEERKRRSVSAGVSYQTDEGPGATVSWENRNLFGGGEKLGLKATYSNFTLSAEGGLLKPFFLRPDQTLRLWTKVARDTPDAYTSNYIQSGLALSRDITESLHVGAAIQFKPSEVTQLGVTNRYSYFSFPLSLQYDTSNELLDPSQGSRLGLDLAPYEDILGPAPAFVKSTGRLTHYISLLKAPSLVFAGALNAGGIAGADAEEIPADERFYAGGGGSIRGYPYQTVGPLVNGVPVGGRSLATCSLELRLKLTERFGVVGFLDGGNVYESTYPDFSEPFLWGTGVGLRYYSPMGPFRLDVAFPLDRRPEIDDTFQIYVSLGQAF
jgi:translocation and assembly module TamA